VKSESAATKNAAKNEENAALRTRGRKGRKAAKRRNGRKRRKRRPMGLAVDGRRRKSSCLRGETPISVQLDLYVLAWRSGRFWLVPVAGSSIRRITGGTNVASRHADLSSFSHTTLHARSLSTSVQLSAVALAAPHASFAVSVGTDDGETPSITVYRLALDIRHYITLWRS